MAVRLDEIDLIWQKIKDRKVLEILEEAEKDKVTIAREVRHFLYFQSKLGRDKCACILKGEGFKIISKDKNDNGYNLVLMHNEAPSDISRTTSYLLRIACQYKGEYDGWETCFLKEAFN